MFNVNICEALKAEGIREEVRESLLERIQRKEESIHESAASWNVFLTPSTLNR